MIENAAVEYSTSGKPKYDDEGNIINAVIFSHTFQNTSFLGSSQEFIKHNSDFKEDDFFYINITPLGIQNSCSPSTTGLKYNFPRYSYIDEVNFKRQFLAEKFKIKKVLGLIGEGLGGYDVLTWACEYPDEMEFIFVLNSACKTSGYRYILHKGLDNILELTDDYYSDTYNTSLTKMLVACNTFSFAHSSSKQVFSNMSNIEIDAIMDDFIDECLFTDIHDYKFQNDCILEYDVEDKLPNIKAKTLVIFNNNNYFNIELDSQPFKDLIEDSIVLTHDLHREDYYFEEIDYSHFGHEAISFLSQFRK